MPIQNNGHQITPDNNNFFIILNNKLDEEMRKHKYNPIEEEELEIFFNIIKDIEIINTEICSKFKDTLSIPEGNEWYNLWHFFQDIYDLAPFKTPATKNDEIIETEFAQSIKTLFKTRASVDKMKTGKKNSGQFKAEDAMDDIQQNLMKNLVENSNNNYGAKKFSEKDIKFQIQNNKNLKTDNKIFKLESKQTFKTIPVPYESDIKEIEIQDMINILNKTNFSLKNYNNKQKVTLGNTTLIKVLDSVKRFCRIKKAIEAKDLIQDIDVYKSLDFIRFSYELLGIGNEQKKDIVNYLFLRTNEKIFVRDAWQLVNSYKPKENINIIHYEKQYYDKQGNKITKKEYKKLSKTDQGEIIKRINTKPIHYTFEDSYKLIGRGKIKNLTN